MTNTHSSSREAILANASSLLEDANILFDHKRYARAAALAILCIEECGKCKLLDWAADSAFKTDSSKQFHAKKQKIIASYETAEQFAAVLKKVTTELGLEIKHISELSEAQKEFRESEAGKLTDRLFEEHFLKEASHAAEEAWRSSRFLRGEYLKLKNNSLYVDIDQTGTIVNKPSDIKRKDAAEIIKQGKSALRIAQRYLSSEKKYKS